MSHITSKLDSGTQTGQNFHNHSNSCIDLDHLDFTKQNYHATTLARIEAGVANPKESFLRSKYGMLWFKNSEAISEVF